MSGTTKIIRGQGLHTGVWFYGDNYAIIGFQDSQGDIYPAYSMFRDKDSLQITGLVSQNPDANPTTPSALMELDSSTGCLLLSRMTQIERNALVSPENGMILYCTDLDEFCFRLGNQWQTFSNILANYVTGPETTPSASSIPAWTGTGLGLMETPFEYTTVNI